MRRGGGGVGEQCLGPRAGQREHSEGKYEKDLSWNKTFLPICIPI